MTATNDDILKALNEIKDVLKTGFCVYQDDTTIKATLTAQQEKIIE
jgi:hypothetical protein